MKVLQHLQILWGPSLTLIMGYTTCYDVCVMLCVFCLRNQVFKIYRNKIHYIFIIFKFSCLTLGTVKQVLSRFKFLSKPIYWI